MNTTKALTDEQIEEVCRRYAAGESQTALAAEYHVSQRTVSNYVQGVTGKDKPARAAAPAAPTELAPAAPTELAPTAPTELAPAASTELAPESGDDSLDVIYNIARGIEIFIGKHTVGELTIHVSRENGSVTVTAAAGGKEITVKHRERP